MYYSRPFKQDPSSRGDYTPPSYNDPRQNSDWYPSQHHQQQQQLQQQQQQQHGLAAGSRQAYPNSGTQQQESITGMLNNFSKALGKFIFIIL